MNAHENPFALPEFPNVVNYASSSSDPSKTLDVYNPANGALITTIRVGDTASVDLAVQKSHKAFLLWSQKTATERGAILIQCAQLLQDHAHELATLLCLENGKPFVDAYNFDCTAMSAIFRFFGSLVDKLPTSLYDRGPFIVPVVREPYGVTAGILPFNWPPIHAAGKAAPSLAAGNTIILKPGEQAPLTVMRLVEILQQALPENALQAIPGNGPEVPQALLQDPLLSAVSFTGSPGAGRAVAQTTAKHLKHAALELGGKNAFVVFEDADIDAAARDALEGGLFNKGEACTAASRILIHESVHDRFVAKLAAAYKRIRVGDGMHSSTHVGPQVSKAQQQRVLDYLQLGKDQGATVAAQAALPTDERLKHGYYVPPTLFTNVRRDMRIAQEEIFGPVQTVCAFKTEQEALDIVNDSPFGLTCIVHTQNQAKGMRVCRRVQAGCVYLNNYSRNVIGLPFGGIKDSGNSREHCIETLDEWSWKKFIQMPSGVGEPRMWRAVGDCFD